MRESGFSGFSKRSHPTSFGFPRIPALSSSSMAIFGKAFSPPSLITLFFLSGRRTFSGRSRGSSRGRAEEVSTTTSNTDETVDGISTATLAPMRQWPLEQMMYTVLEVEKE
ncbi:Uncharacterized protein Fot_22085 [Forsythia ovata]|uniref:Uncharacterized protein n=1 Tax=Forsythia ovata TaxID=205694 RepID=A0ABD1UWP9_9LAMI